jgi:hypothetical protein
MSPLSCSFFAIFCKCCLPVLLIRSSMQVSNLAICSLSHLSAHAWQGALFSLPLTQRCFDRVQPARQTLFSMRWR